MSQLKKVCFKLSLVNTEKNRKKVISRLENPEIIRTEKILKKGYKEMGSINLSLAEMCFEAESESLRLYEEKLTECE